MRENRGPWYLFTGLVIGVALGLFWAWVIDPVEYVDTPPASLRVDFKDQYRSLIAAAFMANGDLPRAQARLSLLEDPNPAQELTIQAQRALAAGQPPTEAQALGLLALALEGNPVQITPISVPATPFPLLTSITVTSQPLTSTPSPSPAASPPLTVTVPASAVLITSTASLASPAASASTPIVTPSPTRRPTHTPTLLPSRTPTPTQGAPYVLDSKEQVCDSRYPVPLLMVRARDKADQPVPGVEVIAVWPGGEEHFFTGLKPEISLGYADFEMTPGVQYTLHLAGGGEPVPGLTPFECQTRSGDRILGSWELIFKQP